MEELIELSKAYSKDSVTSVERNRHMNDIDEGEKIQQRHADAVVVDFVNFIARQRGIDLGLYSEDLKEEISINEPT